MRHAVPHLEQSLFRRERQVKKDKLLRRLSANSDAWLQDPWPWDADFDTDE